MVMENEDKVSEVRLSQWRHLRVVGHILTSSKSKGGPDRSSHEDRRCRGEVGGASRDA